MFKPAYPVPTQVASRGELRLAPTSLYGLPYRTGTESGASLTELPLDRMARFGSRIPREQGRGLTLTGSITEYPIPTPGSDSQRS